MTLQNEYDNYLMWGVTSPVEVALLQKNFNYPMIKFEKHVNPFHAPRAEWTEEMLQQEKDFKLKYGTSS